MRSRRVNRGFGLLWLVPVALLLRPDLLPAQERFDLLQIGTQSYTNVTVTTKADDYIFIVHAGGMNNIKLSKLPVDVRVELGYKPPVETNKPVAKVPLTNGLPQWAKQLPPGSQKQLVEIKSILKAHGMPALSKIKFPG